MDSVSEGSGGGGGKGVGERATVMLGIVIDHTMSTPYTQPSSEQTEVGTTANPIAG